MKRPGQARKSDRDGVGDRPAPSGYVRWREAGFRWAVSIIIHHNPAPYGGCVGGYQRISQNNALILLDIRRTPHPPPHDPRPSTNIQKVGLSSVEDLTAVVAVFRDDADDEPAFDVRAHFFLPRDSIARKEEADRADYLKWAEAGWLTLTEGNRVDYRRVTEHVIGLVKDHDADSDECGRVFQFKAATCSDLKPATIPM